MKAHLLAIPLAFATSAVGAETLALYNWGDYINPEVLAKFTEETVIEVTLDTYSSNEEMLAKIQAGANGYDIVFPSVWMQDIMVKLDLLHETKINESAGFANIGKDFLRWTEDPDSSYCLPYVWGTVGIFYNEDTTGPISGWADFFAIPETSGVGSHRCDARGPDRAGRHAPADLPPTRLPLCGRVHRRDEPPVRHRRRRALCTPHGLRLAIPAGLAEGSKATAVLRPTDFILGGAGITGAVTRAIYIGADLHLHVAPKGGGPEIGVIARDSAEAPREGATVTLGYDPATMHLMEGAE